MSDGRALPRPQRLLLRLNITGFPVQISGKIRVLNDARSACCFWCRVPGYIPRLIELNLFYDLAIRKQPPKNREGGRSQAEEPFDLPELRPVTLFDGCANVPAGCTDSPWCTSYHLAGFERNLDRGTCRSIPPAVEHVHSAGIYDKQLQIVILNRVANTNVDVLVTKAVANDHKSRMARFEVSLKGLVVGLEQGIAFDRIDFLAANDHQSIALIKPVT